MLNRHRNLGRLSLYITFLRIFGIRTTVPKVLDHVFFFVGTTSKTFHTEMMGFDSTPDWVSRLVFFSSTLWQSYLTFQIFLPGWEIWFCMDVETDVLVFREVKSHKVWLKMLSKELPETETFNKNNCSANEMHLNLWLKLKFRTLNEHHTNDTWPVHTTKQQNNKTRHFSWTTGASTTPLVSIQTHWPQKKHMWFFLVRKDLRSRFRTIWTFSRNHCGTLGPCWGNPTVLAKNCRIWMSIFFFKGMVATHMIQNKSAKHVFFSKVLMIKVMFEGTIS